MDKPTAKKKLWLIGRIAEIDLEKKQVVMVEQKRVGIREYEDVYDEDGQLVTYTLSYDEKYEDILDKCFEEECTIKVKVYDWKIVDVSRLLD